MNVICISLYNRKVRCLKSGHNFGYLEATDISKFGWGPPKFEILIFHCTYFRATPTPSLVLIKRRGQDIEQTTLTHRPTARLTVAKHYGPFFKGGIKSNKLTLKSRDFLRIHSQQLWNNYSLKSHVFIKRLFVTHISSIDALLHW